MPERIKIVTREELRALKKMMAEQRRIIDVLSQRLQVVVSSVDCVCSMLERYGTDRPLAEPQVSVSGKSARTIICMLADLKGLREENSPDAAFDGDEQAAVDELTDAEVAVAEPVK